MTRVIERALVVIGLCCLGWYGLAAADAAYREQQARDAIAQMLATPPVESVAPLTPSAPMPTLERKAEPAHADDEATGVTKPDAATRATLLEPAAERAPAAKEKVADSARALATNVVGLLEIPRLRFSTPILEGDDAQTLRGAAGHLPDTPHPWEAGNSAIAAHRDGIFRPLRNIRVGDELRVQTARGEVRYKVSDTHIVLPSDLSVLESKRPHMLTLITCYPFNYIGAAPKRFIVHAERVVE